jgi:hypothetical protein
MLPTQCNILRLTGPVSGWRSGSRLLFVGESVVRGAITAWQLRCNLACIPRARYLSSTSNELCNGGQYELTLALLGQVCAQIDF